MVTSLPQSPNRVPCQRKPAECDNGTDIDKSALQESACLVEDAPQRAHDCPCKPDDAGTTGSAKHGTRLDHIRSPDSKDG